MIERELLNLCYEYDLHESLYLLLKLVEESGPLRWDTAADYTLLKEVSGNPAALLRHLIDRGLLSGPARGQKIQTAPFALTDQGRELLGKIERGLHTPAWLSEHKVKALERLNRPHPVAWSVMKAEGIRRVTLRSLVDNGYICISGPGWEITDLGREALAEWSAQIGEAA